MVNVTLIGSNRLSENDPTVTEILLQLQGKTPSERRTSLLKVYPHLAGKIRRASSFIHAQRDAVATSTLGSLARLSTEMPAQSDPTSNSPWPLLEPLLPSEASSPTTRPPTPLEWPPVFASQTSFHTADSRVNMEGADLDEGPSPSRFNRDEDQYDSDDESVEGFPDTLLTPLYLVPHLTSDMENGQRFSQHFGYENDVVFSKPDSEEERFHDRTPATESPHDADSGFMTTEPASRPLPPPALRLELNFPVTGGPSMLEELSSLSPHFATLPLLTTGPSGEQSYLLQPPRAPNTNNRNPGAVALVSPRQARLNFPRTLWPTAAGHFERRSASTSPTVTPRSEMHNTATPGSMSVLGADGAELDDEQAGSTSEMGSPSWWGIPWWFG